MISGTGNRPGNQCLSSSGFSLLEVMISLGLISIIVGFFAVQFSFSDDSDVLEQFHGEIERLVLQTSRSCNAFGEDRIILISKSEWVSGSQKLAIPENIKLTLKRPHQAEFASPETMQWIFRPGGLIEPVKLRMESESAYRVVAFDSVTGRSSLE